MHTLNTLANMYIEQIRTIINRLQNKIVVLDFDGTMTQFRYASDRLLPCRDDEIYEYSKSHNIYENARMLATMQYVVSQLNPENVYVLTRTEKTLIEKKNVSILKNFNILPEHIFHVQQAHLKLEVLDMLHKKHNSDIIFIEDTFKTILEAEEAMDFVHGIHISEFIA